MSLRLSPETLTEAESVIKVVQEPFGINLNPFDIPVVKRTLQEGVERLKSHRVSFFGERRQDPPSVASLARDVNNLRDGAELLNPRNDDGEPITRFPISIGDVSGGADILNIPNAINVGIHSVSHSPASWDVRKSFTTNM